MASVNVRQEGQIIHATYTGTMTLELVREGERQIEEIMARMRDACILYDTLAMDPPAMKLALEMKAFDTRVGPRVSRSATVVHDAMTAFTAKVAFALSRNHRVFYDDLEAAYRWLEAR
jgi:hypothetical protein